MVKEETYDVIDRDGTVIGQATWTEVHSKGLLHRNVHGVLFHDETRSKTLLKKRTINTAQEPGEYEIAAAGHVLTGESPELSMHREIDEELFGNQGLPKDITITKLGEFLNNDFPNNNEIVTLFEIIHPGPFTLQEAEASKMWWMEWEELLRDIQENPRKYTQYSLNAIEAYMQKHESKQ